MQPEQQRVRVRFGDSVQTFQPNSTAADILLAYASQGQPVAAVLRSAGPDPENYVGNNPVPAGEYEAVAAPAGETVEVHIIKGREQLPVNELDIKSGRVNVAPLAQMEGVVFQEIAIEDSGSVCTPRFHKFDNYNVQVTPGQKVILKAKPAGPNWLIKVLTS